MPTRINVITALESMTGYAKKGRSKITESIRRKNTPLSQKVIDAVIVNFINFVGVRFCCDYALYANDLIDPIDDRENKSMKQISATERAELAKFLAKYLVSAKNILLSNRHMHSNVSPEEINALSKDDIKLILDNFTDYFVKEE